MTQVRKADPAARRAAVWTCVAGAIAGGLLLADLQQYRPALIEWLAADRAETAARLQLLFGALAVLLAAPLLGLAAWLWSLGGRAIRAAEFPPPGMRVIRDTPVVCGDAAVSRGRMLRAAAILVVVAAVAACALLWRVGTVLG
jgi:hypothetical protein